MSDTHREMMRCRECERRTMHVQNRPAHLVHFFITLVTFGLWLLPWLWVTLKAGPPKCTECGNEFGFLQFRF